MPDENAVPTPSELERLVAEAEQHAQPLAQVTDHPKPCEHSSSTSLTDPAFKKCPTCLFYFCEACASVLDPTYCCLCLPLAEGEFKTEPLRDE